MMTRDIPSTEILRIQKSIEQILRLFEYFNGDDSLDDYSAPVCGTAQIAEAILLILFEERGCVVNNGMVVSDSTGNPVTPAHKGIPFAFFRENWETLGIPFQISRFVDVIRQYRNASAHAGGTTYSECVIFAEAFSYFLTWFAYESTSINKYGEEFRKGFLASVNKFKNKFVYWTMIDIHSQEQILSSSNFDQLISGNAEPKENANEIIQQILTPILQSIDDVKNGVAKIEKKVDKMAEQLTAVYDSVVNYQALLERQISIAASDDEIDRIIKAYSDEVSTRIAREVNEQIAVQEFEVEQKRLQESLSETVWQRLDESSKEFLTTAKITYSNYGRISGAVDYSGVCLLVTKAIEVEMNNRFCRDYLAFLKEKYPGKSNHSKYPYVMRNKYGKPIKTKDFTLGSVVYVLGVRFDDALSQDERDIITDEIMDFCRTKIMVGKDDSYIEDALEQIADGIETIRKDYRNPSAHTNQLQKVNAKECFDLVLDVEKLLKNIIDLLDY